MKLIKLLKFKQVKLFDAPCLLLYVKTKQYILNVLHDPKKFKSVKLKLF